MIVYSIQAQFNKQQIISTSTLSPTRSQPIDIDGLLDVISYSNGGNKLAWQKNTGILDVNQNVPLRLSIYLNPTQEVLYLNPVEEIQSIRMYSVSGQRLELRFENNRIDLSILPSRVYILHLTYRNGVKQH